MKQQEIDFKSWLYYDSSSPSGLRWMVDRVALPNTAPYNIVSKGDVAGTLYKGYWRVGVLKRYYTCSRVILEIHGVNVPRSFRVDHKDGNTLNNNFDNLRSVTNPVNCRNAVMKNTNSSGVTGVSWSLNGVNNTYAKAYWNDLEGKQKVKYFSVKKHGLLTAFKLAVQYRDFAIDSLNNVGAGYTDRHGK